MSTRSTYARRRGRAPGTRASTTSRPTTDRRTVSRRPSAPASPARDKRWTQLIEMQRNAVEYAHCNGLLAEDEAFYAQQNALTVRNAEAYYRAMFSGRVTSWNLRDQHMAQTLEALQTHLDRHNGREPARIVVWAHNSHVGDARATEVTGDGQLTLGQLARERYGDDCRLIGFTTYTGTVTAAGEWGGIAERKVVRPAVNGSVEELFHETGDPDFVVSAIIDHSAAEPLDTVRLSRAIGVIYLPETERQSHYYHVRPSEQFDAIIHVDDTRALEPLEVTSVWVAGETPETYPTGL
ncbi:erythromycin esterase family protein [Mycolicibacterium sp. XJ1819]